MLKAILIDLDGTLADTIPILFRTYLKFLEKAGYQGNSEEFQELNGPALSEIVNYLKEKYHLKETSENLLKVYQQLLQTFYLSEMQLFPGVREFLTFAKSHHLKLAVVTSAPYDITAHFLSAQKIEKDFDLIASSEDVKKAKPFPEIYQKAIKKLGIRKEEAIAIEDSLNGVKAALAAGIKTLHFSHGVYPQSINGVVKVENWFEILEYIKNTS